MLYDRKYLKHLGMLQMHWLGYFFIMEKRESRAINLTQLDGALFPSWVNDGCLKPYGP